MPDQSAFSPPPCFITCCMVVMLFLYSGVSLATTFACIRVFMVSNGCVVVTASNPPVIPAIMKGVLEGYPSRTELPVSISVRTGVTPKYPPVYNPSRMNVGPCRHHKCFFIYMKSSIAHHSLVLFFSGSLPFPILLGSPSSWYVRMRNDKHKTRCWVNIASHAARISYARLAKQKLNN